MTGTRWKLTIQSSTGVNLKGHRKTAWFIDCNQAPQTVRPANVLYYWGLLRPVTEDCSLPRSRAKSGQRDQLPKKGDQNYAVLRDRLRGRVNVENNWRVHFSELEVMITSETHRVSTRIVWRFLVAL